MWHLHRVAVFSHPAIMARRGHQCRRREHAGTVVGTTFRGDRNVQKFWGWLGLNLGKHWVLALLTGAVLTIGFGFGITKLEFSTSQSNYLNKSDQVYKDNVKYQDLFGGQAMVTLVTMNPGHTVAELFENGNLAQWRKVDAQLRASGYAESVVSPLTALQFNDNLVRSPNGNPADSVAGKILLETTARDHSAKGSQLR